MKTTRLSLFLLIALLGIPGFVSGQKIYPKLIFEEFPVTHNAHITGDSKNLYTCNAGNASKGYIWKYDNAGNIIQDFKMDIDMRAIMYCKKDKGLYVNSYDQNIYEIVDLEAGIFKNINTPVELNEQAAVALGVKGKKLYHFEDGKLDIYSFPDGKLLESFQGLKCGSGFLSGKTTVAVSKKHIYTMDGEKQEIYAYDMKGNYVKTFYIAQGSYGFSLSYANGLVFISEDGNYDTGTWYGYDLGLK